MAKIWNYEITISSPFQHKRVVTLTDGEHRIGRSMECSVLLVGEFVSRNHARLDLKDGEVGLMDLGSASGTQVDGAPLNPRQRVSVQPGQAIHVGGFSLTVAAIEREASFCLVWHEGDLIWRRMPLGKQDVIIGRGEDAKVKLTSSAVSRHHAVVSLEKGKVFLLDPGSQNGVYLNGELIQAEVKTPLQTGDSFTIDQYTFTLKPESKSDSTEPIGAPGEQEEAGAMNTMFVGGENIQVEWQNYPLVFKDQDRIVIGRTSDNGIVLNHPTISRYHAVIERMGTRYRITDLHSANGTYLNGKAIDAPEWIKPDDTIKIGPCEFLFTGAELRGAEETGVTIEALHLRKQVNPKTNLLQDINLNIGANEFVAIVGTSGAGKTTLMDALNGFRRATSGQVLVNGMDFYQNYDMFRNDIGYVPQKDIVHLELTPEQALEYSAQLRMPPDTQPAERKKAVDSTLAELGLSERRNLPISLLSGGQLKRVSIGVELLTKPRLFFLDEPTSGLDPGTEYDMMKLLRRLADQGRTIFIVTHATKNVILCDKVVIMTRGGYVAFFGPPEEALVYFDQYRLDRERLEKNIEFDDVYRILNDPERGSAADWDARFRAYQGEKQSKTELPAAGSTPPPMQPAKKRQVSGLRQFLILSARNLRIIFQDRVTLGLMLALAPLLGLMNFIWGNDLFDPVSGQATKILVMWFMAAIVGTLVGSLSSVREIVKEADIYKRERAVNLKLLPYLLSKLWVGVVLAIYQSGFLLLFLILLTRPVIPDPIGYLYLYITMVLGILAGYLTGLLVSALVPNQNAALIVVIAVLVPQFLFTGVLLPLKQIPGGEIISIIIPTRWSFEGFVRSTQMGEVLAADPCWKLPEDERNALSDEEKEQCSCMGSTLFERCVGIPGLFSPSYYDDESKSALAQVEPEKPLKPEALATYTPHPTFTPLATFTPVPTLTPIPPRADMAAWMAANQAQMEDYFTLRGDQEEEFAESVKTQLDEYLDLQKEQGELMADESSDQFTDYGDEMEDYGEVKSTWEKDRQKAISGAETMLKMLVDDFRPSLEGNVFTRWYYLIGLNIGMFLIIVLMQKLKDTK